MTDRQAEVTRFLAKVMEDRIALVVAGAMDDEINNILEGEAEAAKFCEEFITMLLSDDDGSRYRQAQIRGNGHYKQAQAQVREWLRGILRTHGARIGKEGEE